MNQLASYNRPSSSRLLARILDTPNLAEQVRALPPAILARLLADVGVEDAGEIVAMATTEQLAEVFDEDLWRSDRPGEDEHFDANRFLVWLEVMLEAGDRFVAQRLFELPEELVTLAIHRQVLVLNIADLMAEMSDSGEDADGTEKALSNCLSEELDDYQLISRHHDGWDNVLAAVLALDRDHHDFLVGILERCCKMSTDYIEDNGGLYDVLTAEESLEADVAADREDRRAEKGHVAPSAAAAFMKLARAAGETPPTEHDPITRAYMRGLARHGQPKAPAEKETPDGEPKRRDLVRLLQTTELWEGADAPRLPASPRDESLESEPLLIRAMGRLSEDAPRQFAARSEELAYIANVLAAGCTFQQRRLRPVEAVRAAIATCNLGLELVDNGRGADALPRAVAALSKYPADGLFRIAYARLNSDVMLAATGAAQRMLRAAATRVQGVDGRALSRAAARVQAAAAEGTPWKAIAELTILQGMFEAGVTEALSGWMDQCPTMSADRSSTSASRAQWSDDPRFFSSTSDLLVSRRQIELVGRSAIVD